MARLSHRLYGENPFLVGLYYDKAFDLSIKLDAIIKLTTFRHYDIIFIDNESDEQERHPALPLGT